MYSEQLEQLIKSVVADGVITEKERAVLHKRAAAEGVDEDEIDVYVDGLIAQNETVEAKPNKQGYEIDETVVNKVVSRHSIYYCNKKPYAVMLPSKPHDIVRIFMNFTFIEKADDKKDEKLGITIVAVSNRNTGSYYDLNYAAIQMGANKVDLYDGYGYWDLKPNVGYEEMRKEYKVFFIDEKTLRTICDASTIKITLSMKDYKEDTDFYIKDINMSGVKSLARTFYRAVVDHEAYADTEVVSTETGKDFISKKLNQAVEYVKNSGTAESLRKEKERLETELPEVFGLFDKIKGLFGK